MRIMNITVIYVLFAIFLFLCCLLFLSKVNCLDASIEMWRVERSQVCYLVKRTE